MRQIKAGNTLKILFFSIAFSCVSLIAHAQAQPLTVSCRPGVDSLAYFYSKKVAYLWVVSSIQSRRSLRLGFRNEELVSWSSDSGDLLKTKVVSSSGCGALFPNGEACSIGLWDESSDCFITGISRAGYPSHIISNFGGNPDVAFIFFAKNSKIPLRQIMIYRPSVGPVYSRTFSPLNGIFTTREEYHLDSFVVNQRVTKFDWHEELPKINVSIKQIQSWVENIQYNDVLSGIQRLSWEELEKE